MGLWCVCGLDFKLFHQHIRSNYSNVKLDIHFTIIQCLTRYVLLKQLQSAPALGLDSIRCKNTKHIPLFGVLKMLVCTAV